LETYNQKVDIAVHGTLWAAPAVRWLQKSRNIGQTKSTPKTL